MAGGAGILDTSLESAKTGLALRFKDVHSINKSLAQILNLAGILRPKASCGA